MARPKSDDPKRALTIRLRSSVVARLGGDAVARARVEAMVERAIARLDAPPKPAAPAQRSASVAVPLMQRKAFNPQPKTGKR
jgi:hypothetical protein